jgi:hypothetical protein
MSKALQILEQLPLLPEEVWVTDLHHQLTAPIEERTGFRHGSGEWNILYKHNGRMYRLPASLAEVKLARQRRFN